MSILETPSLAFSKIYLLSLAGKGRIPLLHPGEILEGILIKQLDSDHAILNLRGQNLVVENRLPLPAGEKYRFRVEEASPKVVLRLLLGENPPEPPIGPMLKRNLSGDFPVEKLMQWMGDLQKTPIQAWPAEIREEISLLLAFFRSGGPGSAHFSPSHLKEVLLQSGLFLENKLLRLLQGWSLDAGNIRKMDLKSLLFLLRAKAETLLAQETPGIEGKSVSDLKQAVDQLLQKIELYQLLNTNPTDLQDKVFLLIPLGIQGQPQFIELGIFFPSKEREEAKEGETGLFFLLHFPDWGRLKIKVKIRDQALFSQFTLTDPKVAQFIQEGFPALAARFREMGYQCHFQVFVEPQEKIESSLFGEMIKDCRSLFNIVV